MNFHTRPDWQNTEVLSINRLRTHASMKPDLAMSLDGTWRFFLAEHPEHVPAGFFLPEFCDRDWQEISVPGNWETQGFGEAAYTNWVYPFPDEPGAHQITPGYQQVIDSCAKMNPPYLPDKIPTGLYRRTFTLPENFVGKQLIINFGGVESGFYVWLNGNPVGYSQDSKLMAEFDASRYLYAGENTISVQVMRFTDATWLEDQDYWHLSGIFRSVTLIARTRMHIRDVAVRADMDGNVRLECWAPRISGFADAVFQVRVFDPDGQMVFDGKKTPNQRPSYFDNAQPDPGCALFEFPIAGARRWSPEEPNLYTADVSICETPGVAADHTTVRFGCRTVSIEDGIFRLNGVRMIFRGVNRHEHTAETGRYVPVETMRREIEMMKSLNINAVRTCHYPDAPEWYDLCDEMGIAVVCETNLETHGVRAMLSRDPEWAEAFLQRARRMVQIHRNHPSILSWSLGNESGYGANQAAMAAWIRHYDPSRTVQYESGAPGREISDIRCPMYPTERQIIDLLTDAGDPRPVILCEYAYQILNSGGGLDKFRALTERFPRFQGGFIWDWQDKALLYRDVSGNTYPAYGGDFGEAVVEPVEPKFMCMNGIVTYDYQKKPVASEVCAAYAPVFVKMPADSAAGVRGRKFIVANRMLSRTTQGMNLSWVLLADGKPAQHGQVTLPAIRPMRDFEIVLEIPPLPAADVFLNFDVIAEGGAAMSQQFCLRTMAPLLPPRLKKPVGATVEEARGMITVTGPQLRLLIAKSSGVVVDASINGVSYVLNALSEAVTRGLSGVNAQPGWGAWAEWNAFTPENSTRKLVALAASQLADGRVLVERTTRLESQTVPGAALDVSVQMKIAGDGVIEMALRFVLGGIASVERLGLTWALPEGFETVEWYGCGPDESYADRRLSAPVGIYRRSVDEMHFPFIPPAENGGHEGVRELTVSDDSGRQLVIRGARPFHFDAHHYTTADLRGAAHEHELLRRPEIVLHIDAAHAGIGGAMAWSTQMDAAYTVGPGEYLLDLEIELRETK